MFGIILKHASHAPRVQPSGPTGSGLGCLPALAVLIMGQALALGGQAPGPDAFGYTVSPTTQFAFLQITNGSPRVLWFDDDTPYTANIGFTFNFYGSNYSTVSFNPNGLMTFVSPSSNYANVDLTSSSPADNLPAIAVLWDDWETQETWSDGVYYKTMGTSGSRQFIVQWNKVVPVNGDGTNTVTFEARLFEGSNRILFSYFDTVVSDETTLPPDAASLGVGATVGIRDINGQANGRNLQWSYNQAVITNGLNLLFTLPNRAPVAVNDAITTLEDTPLTVNLLTNDSDPDADPITLVSVTQATNGTVATNLNGTVTYAPATNYVGPDFFTYTISDGQGGSATGQVSVTVMPVNDRPTLDALNNLTLNEDSSPQTVTLTGISSGAANENQTLTVTASNSNPALVTDLNVSYTSPNSTGMLDFALLPNANGNATITVTVNDGQPSNNIVNRSFTVTVSSVNTLPTISAIPDQTNYENTVIGPVAFSVGDLETPPANLTLSASSTNTTLVPTNTIVFGGSESNRTITITPSRNRFGTTLITVTVEDSDSGTASHSFLVIVTPLPPGTLSIAAQSDGAMVIQLLGSPGSNYLLQASSDFVTWSNLGNLVEGEPGIFQLEDGEAPQVEARYYRVLSP